MRIIGSIAKNNFKPQTVIPDWASNNFWLNVDGEIEILIVPSPQLRKLYQSKKDELKLLCDVTDWRGEKKENIRFLATTYMICNLVLGIIDRQKAVEDKVAGKPANDGLQRQHWIPECYLKSFAEKGLIRKVECNDLEFSLEDISKIEDSKKVNRTVSIKSDEFCEPAYAKGEMYDPYYEIFLSKCEGDYALIAKDSSHIDTLWDFLVLSSFFWVLRCRTKEMKEINHSAWQNKQKVLLGLIPEVISGMEIIRIDPKESLSNAVESNVEGKFPLPFSQHPIYNMREKFNPSLWAIFTPECLLWFRYKKSKHKEKHIDNLVPSVINHLIGNSTTRDLYFRPSDNPWFIVTDYRGKYFINFI